VVAEARASGKEVHFGHLFGICVEKNSELAPDNPARKFKGRVVFQGNQVRDQAGDWALFEELSSAPATMEAGEAVDAYGCAEGNLCQQADGTFAYTQALLGVGGVPTWVRIPMERWPKAWIGKYKDPVVPLRLALYGHPDAGGFWEKHCEKHILSEGFTSIPDWRSVYWHPELKVLLIVYVDDFKMSGPESSVAKGWEGLRKGLVIEDPTPAGKFLGCNNIVFRHTIKEPFNCLSLVADCPIKSGESQVGGANVERRTEVKTKTVNMVKYDQKDFLKQCVSRYIELTGKRSDTLSGNTIYRYHHHQSTR
jgi:hypothetical protein